MSNADALVEFKHGVDLLRNGHPANAIQYFRSAAEAETQNPYYLSFLGLSVARAHRKWDAALELCQAAVRLKPGEPQLYLNLAEVYVAASRREDAVELLEAAIARFGCDARIQREHRSLGKTMGRVLPFLRRERKAGED